MILPRAIAEKIMSRCVVKPGNVNVTVSISQQKINRASQEIMEMSDVMQNWGNPAVREAYLAYKHRRNFG